MTLNNRRDKLMESICGSVPRSPGVYLFYDRHHTIMYIGKSVNLRQRMLSYFKAGQTDLENRKRQMIFSIDEFAFRETGSELLALLLEDALIKQEMPTYNVLQREYTKSCYLTITDDACPACRIVDCGNACSGDVYGPFRDRYFAAKIVGILSRYFHLRSCAGSYPVQRCVKGDLGLCSGPCRDKVTTDEYQALVQQARGFMTGDKRLISQKLETEMMNLSAALDYEKAKEIREYLKFCLNFCTRQHFLKRFETGHLKIQEDTGSQFAYMFRNGDLIDVTDGSENGFKKVEIPQELLKPLTDPRFVLDRADLIYTWLNRHKESVTFTFREKKN
jgi:excinuclease ABC subunit C